MGPQILGPAGRSPQGGHHKAHRRRGREDVLQAGLCRITVASAHKGANARVAGVVSDVHVHGGVKQGRSDGGPLKPQEESGPQTVERASSRTAAWILILVTRPVEIPAEETNYRKRATTRTGASIGPVARATAVSKMCRIVVGGTENVCVARATQMLHRLRDATTLSAEAAKD